MYGIRILNASSNFFGEWNIISGNSWAGVSIEGEQAENNIFWKNYIGTNKEGKAGVPNKFGVNISDKAHHNLIGREDRGEGNLISGNSVSGVNIEGQETKRNEVWGNDIGINTDGDKIPNEVAGIHIHANADSNIIKGNTISGNKWFGVEIENNGTENNEILENHIGTNTDGDKIPNEHQGVYIHDKAKSNIIKGNIISGNGWYGVEIKDDETYNNEILENYIGTNKDGDTIPNEHDGVYIVDDAKTNIIKGNTISGNKNNGVNISGEGTEKNEISENYIGTNKDGDTIPNERDGIYIWSGANSNIIISNTISGNKWNGVEFSQEGTENNEVLENDIGTNKDGDTIPNINYGVVIQDKAKLNIIKGNTISGNKLSGVRIQNERTEKNEVLENYIGTNEGGDKIPNEKYGILIEDEAKSNIIKGNTISGNMMSGVWIQNVGTENNEVLENFIGINKDGGKIPNEKHGVYLQDKAMFNIIKGNTISGNKENGLELKGPGTWVNTILENFIGTDSKGTYEIPNEKDGIYLRDGADANVIKGNTISGNEMNGVKIKDCIRNKVLDNHIGESDYNVLIDLGNHTGVNLNKSDSNIISNNRINYNCRGIVENGEVIEEGDPTQNTISNNFISSKWCLFTGIHLHNSISIVTGNTITGDAGDGILCDHGSQPTISKNSIFGNDGFGINNQDPSVTIDAQSNWWGDTSGPGGTGPGTGEEVSDYVNFSNWLTDPVAVVVTTEQDTVFIPSGEIDSVLCSFQNWENLNDILIINVVADFPDWLPAPTDFTVTLEDSMGAGTEIGVSVPTEVPVGATNTVRITAESQTDPGATDVDSFVVTTYDRYR